jgi:hypothetical protein
LTAGETLPKVHIRRNPVIEERTGRANEPMGSHGSRTEETRPRDVVVAGGELADNFRDDILEFRHPLGEIAEGVAGVDGVRTGELMVSPWLTRNPVPDW